jgi:hypothetical protein
MPVLLGTFLAYGVSEKISTDTQNPYLVVNFLMLSLFLSGALTFLTSFSFRKFEDLEDEVFVPLLMLSSGDSRRAQEFDRENELTEKKANFWSSTIIAGFLVSITASLVVNFLS